MSDFTYDWLTPQVQELPTDLLAVEMILELGTFEGRSAVWFLDHYPKAFMTCVDSFVPAGDLAEVDFKEVKRRCRQNLAPYESRVEIVQATSREFFLRRRTCRYDVVHIDGSHRRLDVLFDAFASYWVLNPGGVLIFDDYGWGTEGMDRPKEAIDEFVDAVGDMIEVVYVGYHLICQRCR